MLILRKEAIPHLLTQAILGLRQVTAQLLPGQLGILLGLGFARQTALFPRWIARSPHNSTGSQATSSTGSQEAGAIPSASNNNNNAQAGSSSGRGNRCSARLRAFQASQGDSATSQTNNASSQGATLPPTTVGQTTPRVLPRKNLTLSVSLTCPANL